MTSVRSGLAGFTFAFFCRAIASAQAGDLNLHDGVWEDHTSGGALVSLSAGAMTGMAREYAYDPTTGAKLSELDWNMKVSETLNLEMTAKINSQFRVYVNGSVALNGDNYMDDYDWITSTAPAPASDHSWHDDTRLDHYYSIDAGGRYSVAAFDRNTVSVLGGLRYTDIQFSAYGGCLNYTSPLIGGPIAGCIQPGLLGITYQQKLPAVYGGVGFEHAGDTWSTSLVGTAGFSVDSDSLDHHWLRGLVFENIGSPSPFVAAKAKIGYSLSNRAMLFLKGDYQHFFQMRDGDSGGMSLETLNVSAGASYKF